MASRVAASEVKIWLKIFTLHARIETSLLTRYQSPVHMIVTFKHVSFVRFKGTFWASIFEENELNNKKEEMKCYKYPEDR